MTSKDAFQQWAERKIQDKRLPPIKRAQVIILKRARAGSK
jgi:hypothetical protein